MIASTDPKTQVLTERNVREKLQHLQAAVHAALSGASLEVPESPGRDVQILPIRDLPPKKGLSFREGQARLLHDLASIELQAMELALRTLVEFPEVTPDYRAQLAEVVLDEGRHLAECLDGLDQLGLPWGSFPTHLGLWQSVSREDSLLDRILVVHRYLEGSGLDASDTLLRRLDGVDAPQAQRAVRIISSEEMGHVQFGSRWYYFECRKRGLDPEEDFKRRLDRLFLRIPRRVEKIQPHLRRQAGFSEKEISILERFRERWFDKEKLIHKPSHGICDPAD